MVALQYQSLLTLPLPDQQLAPSQGTDLLAQPDRRDGRVYRFTPELALAANIAAATSRPLLLYGPPGTGKSSFAAFVARYNDCRYYEHTITARSEGSDLLYRFDAVRRLADAQRREASKDDGVHRYVEPGALWWILNRETARWRGAPPETVPEAREPFAEQNAERASGAVLLIDEIDKADPDLPNSLLVPLGSYSFDVPETGVRIERPKAADGAATEPEPPLVIITTNQERALPDAFERRCIVHHLEPPTAELMVDVAALHFGEGPGHVLSDADREIACWIAERVEEEIGEAREARRRPPGIAEFLDAVRAVRTLDIATGPLRGDAWDRLRLAALAKHR